MRRYKVNLSAGQVEPLAISGDYVRVVSSSDEIKIETNSQSLQGMQKGMAYRAPMPFTELKLTSETAQLVEIMAGTGLVEDNRATISGTVDVGGVVEVINANKSRTEQNKAFIFGRGIVSGISQYGFMYLANPPGSGVGVYVNKLIASSPLSNKAFVLRVTDDYLALEAETGFTLQLSNNGLSKKIGGLSSKALFRMSLSDNVSPINQSNTLTFDVLGSEFKSFSFTEPFLIEEGKALIISSADTDDTVRAHFEWFEESNT